MLRVVEYRSLAGLARDASAARLVNVLPGDEPQDATERWQSSTT